ncbi:hypothetical protein ACHQM5_005251 [Ranunculus cassubicifolius]
MSEPNTPSSSSIIHHQHHQFYNPHHHQPLPHQPFITTHIPSPSTTIVREYRKGNWTLHETLVLITAKKLDDERRTKASITPPDPTNKGIHSSSSSSTRTAELRWKWVENYCWNNGCLRSQNQCNDKWDNLLRDYKKVREYEARSSNGVSSSNDLPSYWKLEKHERKERNLPTNLLSEVFEALNEVVHRRFTQSKLSTPLLSSPSSEPPQPANVVLSGIQPPPPPHLLLPPPLAPPPPPPPPPAATTSGETTESSESNQSERVTSDLKRRRKVKNVGSSVLKGVSMLAQTLASCEEKKERRHKDIIELEERRLKIEETRNEVNREGIAGLISAVNNLSGAIHALVSDRLNRPT